MISEKLIVLAGLPGSGKSKLAEALSRHFSLPLFSADPIEAAMWRGGLSRNQTGIAAYEVAQTLAEEHLQLGHSVIIDAVNPPEKLRAVFKDLVEKHAVFDAVVAERIIPDEDAKIDEQGVLKLKGHVQTAPKQVKYQLGFIQSEGAWKLSGVTIDIK